MTVLDEKTSQDRRNDHRQGTERLIEAEHNPLLVPTSILRNKAAQRWPHDSISKGRNGRDGEEPLDVMYDSQKGISKDQGRKSRRNKGWLAKSPNETPHQAPLQNDPKEPHVS